ncbi:uncharacterized protein Triagg1_2153 [Trichoderma aggressivum f. europaeum]|uniref:Uncharacterized protein n=1 Tax=Trichoderma aggressivum f. europaeum TaxID=173218 RepID=A0AAE1IKR1_9HYPO|nr:hypothetical protein Triagg1_2153 [Trichoderma aggressivum f. europaeum]
MGRGPYGDPIGSGAWDKQLASGGEAAGEIASRSDGWESDSGHVSQALADPPCSPDFSSPIRSARLLARVMVDQDRVRDRGWDRPGTCVEELLAKRTVESSRVELIVASRPVGLEEERRRAWPTFLQPSTDLVWVEEQQQ